ncbi:hypothetical protein [uncultured Demequina sp.]|uniref:hypothetical protein n=1 Tax=uncultured Demequina sp. TaxID=693499 RepID=UPI0025CC6CE0|nr:hypothetical protein [uncultured Demequina sp.]
MTRFVFIYHAPPMPADAPPPDPADAKQMMDAWYAWADTVGEGLVDLGTPLMGGVRVTPGGQTDSSLEVAGYSILDVADKDTALAFAAGHPHLQMAGGCTIEVHEAMPLPGSES